MKFLSLIFLVLISFSSLLNAATGDITSVVITSDGWSADVTVSGLSTGGTYSFGLGTNNDPATGTPKAVFTVTRQGYSDTGTVTTVTDTIYGTHALRKPYPLQAEKQEVLGVGDVTFRFALSEYVYSSETVTASLLGGIYTQAATPTASYSGSVINNSTVSYQKVIAAWNVVPFQKVGSSFKLKAGAFHRDGRSGRPVRVVKFTVSDGTTTLTQYVTDMTVDPSEVDAVPISEYIATFNTSSLIEGSTLTCNFIAYPWVGNSSSLLDTSLGTVAPTPLHGPITMVLDRTGAYGVTCALVNATSGNDSGPSIGLAYDSTVFNEATASKFATIAGAAKAIKDYNTTNHGRSDVGAGIIYLDDGSHSWIGANLGAVYGSTPATWITIRPSGGSSTSDCFITGTFGQTDISDRVKFENLSITSANSFTGIGASWYDNCDINASNTSLFRPGVHWLTQCNIIQLTQGLKSFSTENCAFAMVRGCNLTGFAGQVHYYNVIGNLKTGIVAGNPRFIAAISGSTAPAPQSQILAYNRIYGFDAGTTGANLMLTAGKTSSVYAHQRGIAIIQNIFERIGTSRASTTLDINTSDGDDFDNCIIWNNTIMGERQNVAYNAKGTLVKWRRYWSVKNNIMHDWNSKHDTFDGEDVASGNRIGSWSNLFGVSYSGNILGGENGDFQNDFDGLRSQAPFFMDDDGDVDDIFKFVDYRANDGVNPGTGNGDYTPLSDSPAYNLQYTLLIPFDIFGNERGAVDSAGAITTYSDGINTPPVVAITSPATSTVTTSPVNLVAIATDTQDGDLGGSVTWTSNVDGAIGTGNNINVPLTVGTHTITASVTDSASASNSDSITLTISTPSLSDIISAIRANATSILIQ